jgi:protein import protein ZIM17
VYTCNRCETRNAISVSRVAWNEGVVIGKCMGCDARHMLADNAGLTDQTNSSRFSNVVNDAIAKGETVRRESLNDAEALADCGVELLPDGNVSLVARAGEETVKTSQKNGRQVIATRRVEDGTPIIVVKKDDATPKVEVVDDTKPAPQLLPASAPVVDLPAGPEPGDVLRVNTDFGVVHVLVPEGVSEGARLELGGVVEVAVPPERRAGDVVGVALPDGTVVSVEVLAEDVGAAISVAFPVVVL